ncbi:hypothetical protein ACFL14_02895 [Patescibacteria group bacterium]
MKKTTNTQHTKKTSIKPGMQTKLTPKLQKELFPAGIKYFSLAWIVFIIIILLIGYMGYAAYKLFQLRSDVSATSSVKIDESYIKKLNTLEDFGDPVMSNEPGFGRDDPFGSLGTTDEEEE